MANHITLKWNCALWLEVFKISQKFNKLTREIFCVFKNGLRNTHLDYYAFVLGLSSTIRWSNKMGAKLWRERLSSKKWALPYDLTLNCCTDILCHSSFILWQTNDWVCTFLSLGSSFEGYQRRNITPYIHILVCHVHVMVQRHGQIKQFPRQGKQHHSPLLKLPKFMPVKPVADQDVFFTSSVLSLSSVLLFWAHLISVPAGKPPTNLLNIRLFFFY